MFTVVFQMLFIKVFNKLKIYFVWIVIIFFFFFNRYFFQEYEQKTHININNTGHVLGHVTYLYMRTNEVTYWSSLRTQSFVYYHQLQIYCEMWWIHVTSFTMFLHEFSVNFISPKVRLVSVCAQGDPVRAQLPNTGMCVTVQGKHCAFTELCFEQTVCFSGGFTTQRGRRHNGGFVCSLHSSQNLRIPLTSSRKAFTVSAA